MPASFVGLVLLDEVLRCTNIRTVVESLYLDARISLIPGCYFYYAFLQPPYAVFLHSSEEVEEIQLDIDIA